MVKHFPDLISQAFTGFNVHVEGEHGADAKRTPSSGNGVNFRSFVDYLRGGERGQAFFELSWNRLFEKLGRRCRA